MKHRAALLASALLASVAGGLAAVPAQAQVVMRWGTPGFWTPQRAAVIRNQINRLQADVQRADRRGTISDREARRLLMDVRDLRQQFRGYNSNGLTNGEVRTLQDRVNRIRVRLRMERLDWDREDYWRRWR